MINFKEFFPKGKIDFAILSFIKKGYKVKDRKIYNPKGKVLKGYLNKGYPAIKVDNQNVPIHRVVGYLKFGEKIFNKDLVIRHLDGDKTNFSFNNLEIGTQKENMLDIPMEKRKNAAYHASSFLRRFTKNEVKLILLDRIIESLSYKDLCIKYKTSKSTLSDFFNKSLYVDKIRKEMIRNKEL